MKTVFTFFSTGLGVSLQPKGRYCKKSKRKIKLEPIYTKEQDLQAKGR